MTTDQVEPSKDHAVSDELASSFDPTAGETGSENSEDWREGVPEEFKKFAANLASPVDAVKMAAGLRQKLSKAVIPPEPGASEEDIANFRQRIGVPSSPRDYAIVFPEDLSERQSDDGGPESDRTEFLEAMHEAGATPAVVQAAVDWYGRKVAAADAAHAAHRETERRRASEILLKEWGTDYERNLEFARRAALTYGGSGLVDRLDRAGLGNDPTLVRAFYRIGQEIGEDELFEEGPRADRRPKLEERARELRTRHDRWTNKDVDRELREIMEQLHGTRPVQTGRG